MRAYLTTELFKEDWQKELAEKAIPKCLNEKYRKLFFVNSVDGLWRAT